MKRFYLDTEFSNFNGWLLSLALVADDGSGLYLVRNDAEIEMYDRAQPMNEWVIENVMPYIFDIPDGYEIERAPLADWGDLISDFLYPQAGATERVQIIADWPEDFRYLIDLLLTGPGESVVMGRQTDFSCIRHVSIYPTDLEGAVQHNSLWDALAIKHYVELAA